jgi:hypothetical protein
MYLKIEFFFKDLGLGEAFLLCRRVLSLGKGQ